MPLDRCGLLCTVPAQVEELDPALRVTLIALAAFSTLWVGALGAAVGSFLNVVIYRLPLGMSLVKPKSRCPACGTPIRAGDNIPILGWLRLRGRCRSCGQPISARYPLVETATALLYLGLAHFELFSGGANLPYGPVGNDRGLGFVLWNLDPILIGLFVFHATLLSALLCLSLIAWDGFPPPRRLTWPTIAFGLLLPIFLPMLHPVLSGLPVDRGPIWASQLGDIHFGFAPGTLVDSIAGLAVGMLIGFVLSATASAFCSVNREVFDNQRKIFHMSETSRFPLPGYFTPDRFGVIAVGSLIGLYLGWQAAVACGLLAVIPIIINTVVSRFMTKPLPVTGLLATSVLALIPMWRTIMSLPWWPK